MLLDPSKHRNMRYAFNSETVSQQVNQPTFRHFTKLDIDFFNWSMQETNSFQHAYPIRFLCFTICQISHA